MFSKGNHQISPFENRDIASVRSKCVFLEGRKGADLLGQLRSGKDQRELGTVVDVEGLADADGDEGLGAEALQGEGHAARGDVPDRAERLEDPHPSPGPRRTSRDSLVWTLKGAPAARVLEGVWGGGARRKGGAKEIGRAHV